MQTKSLKKIVVFFFLFANVLVASGSDLKKLFADAEYLFLYEDYHEALKFYYQIIENDPDNANVNFRIGECLYYLGDNFKRKSLPYFEKAVKNITKNYREGNFTERSAPVEAYFMLASVYHVCNRFEEAISAYNKYKEELNVKDVSTIEYVNKQIQACNMAKEIISKPITLKKKALGNDINFTENNHNAVVSADENTMVFMNTRKFYEAIFYTTKENGQWKEPVNIMSQLVVDDNYYVTSLSSDGTEMYLYENNLFNRDIYVSRFKNGTWTPVQKLDKNINTKYWESHAAISADGKRLYFISNRPGGYGGLDIYVTDRKDDGTWTEPQNLGGTINTPYNEDCPFITNQDNTLYFSSQGHSSIGGYDVFYSSFTKDKIWSEPINIGFPVNTTDDDLFFYPVENGNAAYYANISDYNSGKKDIYRIVLRALDDEETLADVVEEVKPYKDNEEFVERDDDKKKNDQQEPIDIIIKGKISLQDIERELDNTFSVVVMNCDSKDTLFRITPESVSGLYSTKLPTGNYELIFKGKGYSPEVKKLVISPSISHKEIIVNAELLPQDVSSGEYLVVQSILFGYNQSELNRDAKIELEKLYKIMNTYPSLYVEVIGNTDSKGDVQYNQSLSIQRARSVIAYLVDRGIKPYRFLASAAGEMQNVAINTNPDGTDNEEGRKYNRRVDLKILNNKDSKIIAQNVLVPEKLKINKYTLYTIYITETTDGIEKEMASKLGIDPFDLKKTVSSGGVVYCYGDFFQKSEGLKILNNAIDAGYKEARMITATELEQMAMSSAATEGDIQESVIILVNASKMPLKITSIKTVEHVCRDGIYRYSFGKFNKMETAREKLEELIQKGFSRAFIMKYQSLLAATIGTTGDSDILADDNVRESSKEDFYTIQIHALIHPVDVEFFKNLNNVRMLKGKDSFHRYYYGEFKTYKEAAQMLEIIRKSGYNDAFIRKMKALEAL